MYSHASMQLKRARTSPRVWRVIASGLIALLLVGAGMTLAADDGRQTADGVGTRFIAPAQPVVLAPHGRASHAMAYDSQRHVATLFGGFYSPPVTYLNDTWEWDGAAWTQVSPAATPAARRGAAMAYDSARGVSVLFGGSTITATLADTWEWSGSNWMLRTPGNAPPQRFDFGLAYDSARGRTVLFGGARPVAVLYGDTWEWDGSNWTQATPGAAPSARSGARLAYDSARNVTVLFGGCLVSGCASLGNDTWEWDGTTWTQRNPANPPSARYWHALAYDSQRQRVVLFGGFDNADLLGDTWEWDGATWTQRCGPDPFPTPCAPPGRREHTLVYDSQAHMTLLFGGYGEAGYLNDTWGWDGSNWILLPVGTTPTPSSTPVPTDTPLATDTPTPGPSPTPTATNTPMPTYWLYLPTVLK